MKIKIGIKIILILIISLVMIGMFFLYFLLTESLFFQTFTKELKSIARFYIENTNKKEVLEQKITKDGFLKDYFLFELEKKQIVPKAGSMEIKSLRNQILYHLRTSNFAKVCLEAPNYHIETFKISSKQTVYLVCKPDEEQKNLIIGVFSHGKIPIQTEFIRSIFLTISVVIMIFILILSNLLLNVLIFRPLKKVYSSLSNIEEIDPDLLISDKNLMIKEFGYLSGTLKKIIERLKKDRENIKMKLNQLKLINEELEKVKEHLIKSEKLATIGELSAGIAHEIGNPLGVIMGYINILKTTTDITPAEQKNILDTIERSVNRIKFIVNGLLDFARIKDTSQTKCNVLNTVKEVVDFVKNQKRFKNTEMKIECTANKGCEAKIPPDRLHQVILNLLFNAQDAIKEAGREKGEINITIENQAKRVLIKVKDNGTGIKEENLQKIFKPFFTTKGKKGTGLGLTISRYILHEYGGYIDIETEYGKGTTFIVNIEEASSENSTNSNEKA